VKTSVLAFASLAALAAWAWPTIASAHERSEVCERADASFAESAAARNELEPASVPLASSGPGDLGEWRCLAEPQALADCRDDSDGLFSAAVGSCDMPGAEINNAAPPSGPARLPPTCDGPACRPFGAPLANDTQSIQSWQPLCGTGNPIHLAPGCEALPDFAQPRPGTSPCWRIERPPRA
jgi:hypothetical protein